MCPLVRIAFYQKTTLSCEASCTKSFLWLKDIANSTQLSKQAKIGLISAGTVTLTLSLVAYLTFRRNRASREGTPLSARRFSKTPSSSSSYDSPQPIQLPSIYANSRDLWAPSIYEREILENYPNSGRRTRVENQNIVNMEHGTDPLPPSSIVEVPITNIPICCKVAGCLGTFVSRSDYK